jgi:hypothetical protein
MGRQEREKERNKQTKERNSGRKIGDERKIPKSDY